MNIEAQNAVEKEVAFEETTLSGINFGFISVCDSLGIYMNPGLPSHWYQVFNLNTREEVGRFCPKGNGHGEYGPVGPLYDFYVEGGAVKTWVFEANEEKLHLWNITESPAKQSTVMEKHAKLPWRNENGGACFKHILIKDSNTVYAQVQSMAINKKEATLPYYQVWNLQEGRKQAEIHVFKKTIANKDIEYLAASFSYSNDAIKPDGSRIVQAMTDVPQLNIIDTETGTVKAFHLGDGMRLPDLESAKELNTYFTTICADDDYIYTVYYGDIWNYDDVNNVNKIYVFDWNGHLVSRVTTKHCIEQIAMDESKKVLYTTSPMDEKLHYIETYELLRDAM